VPKSNRAFFNISLPASDLVKSFSVTKLPNSSQAGMITRMPSRLRASWVDRILGMLSVLGYNSCLKKKASTIGDIRTNVAKIIPTQNNHDSFLDKPTIVEVIPNPRIAACIVYEIAFCIACGGGEGKVSSNEPDLDIRKTLSLSDKFPMAPFSSSMPAKTLASMKPDISSTIAVWARLITVLPPRIFYQNG